MSIDEHTFQSTTLYLARTLLNRRVDNSAVYKVCSMFPCWQSHQF
uniref:Uncharacterized protein n=1 Tax=virus sp. ctmTa7 TaxID=2828255 RepID=A0A8S5RCI5_9VIRU|nr:MAG TPA: hypothetical protein [virus sp. ctmTa7]